MYIYITVILYFHILHCCIPIFYGYCISVFCIADFLYFVLLHFHILYWYISVFCIATFLYFTLLHFRILHCYISVFCIATFPYFALLHFHILHCYISVFALLHFCICISAYHYWTICISIIQLQMINIYRPSFIPITFLLNDSGKSVFFQIRKKFVGSSEGNLQGIHQILRSNLIGS